MVSGYAGQLLGRRYRLVEPVGSGGMAVVWRASDEVLGRDVAVKLLAEDLATDQTSRARIQAEAQAVAQLSHPNITAVHDYGESPDDGTRYVVMELLSGQLLSTRLRSGPMSWRRSTQIGAQIAAALAAAHHRGIVHRDIKPTNIMLTSAGVKVMDFGVAGLAGSPEPDGEETVFGTPAYLAPERLIGNTVLPATDVYALGVLLYRCLTDRLPWDADTPTQMLANHVYEQPLPMPLIEGLPPVVIGLVNRCLAKVPGDRPTAVDCARLLSGVTGIHVVLPDTDGVATQEVRVPADQAVVPEPGPRHARSARRRNRGRYWAAAAILVAAAGAAGVVAFARDRASSSPPGCLVTFYLRPQPEAGRGSFSGRVTVVNSGTVTRRPWRVTFTLPGGQRVTQGDGRTQVTQKGNSVALTGPEALPPGSSVTAGFVGGEGRPGTPPTTFALNGARCRLALIGTYDLPPTTGVTSPPPNIGSQAPGLDQGPGLGPPPEHPPLGSPPPGPPGDGPPAGGLSPLPSQSSSVHANSYVRA